MCIHHPKSPNFITFIQNMATLFGTPLNTDKLFSRLKVKQPQKMTLTQKQCIMAKTLNSQPSKRLKPMRIQRNLTEPSDNYKKYSVALTKASSHSCQINKKRSFSIAQNQFIQESSTKYFYPNKKYIQKSQYHGIGTHKSGALKEFILPSDRTFENKINSIKYETKWLKAKNKLHRMKYSDSSRQQNYVRIVGSKLL